MRGTVLTITPILICFFCLSVPSHTRPVFLLFRMTLLGGFVGASQAMVLFLLEAESVGQTRLATRTALGAGYTLLFASAHAAIVWAVGYMAVPKFTMLMVFVGFPGAQLVAFLSHLVWALHFSPHSSVDVDVDVDVDVEEKSMWRKVGRIAILHLGLLSLPGQLAIAMWFKGLYFSLGSEVAKVMMCVLYPVLILVFKVIQRLSLLEPESAQEVQPVIEFGSLALAALPYRVIFIKLNNWVTFVLVVLVEVLFKAIIYPVRLTPAYGSLLSKVRSYATCLATPSSSTSTSTSKSSPTPTPLPPSLDDSGVALTDIRSDNVGGGGAVAQTEETHEHAVLALTFFFHMFLDTVSILGVAALFTYLRFARNNAKVSRSELTTHQFSVLLAHLALSFVVEVGLIATCAIATRVYPTVHHFHPLKKAQTPILNQTVSLSLFYTVAYLGTFVAIDLENIPTS